MAAALLWCGLLVLLVTSLTYNITLHHKLQQELSKPPPEPKVIVETRVVEKPVAVAVNHVESRGMGGWDLNPPPRPYLPPTHFEGGA